jgi:hypothetical protein
MFGSQVSWRILYLDNDGEEGERGRKMTTRIIKMKDEGSC